MTREKITETCIACGRSFTTQIKTKTKYKIEFKPENVWARTVTFNCTNCNLLHTLTQAKVGKPKSGLLDS
jgi:hypothetical protein